MPDPNDPIDEDDDNYGLIETLEPAVKALMQPGLSRQYVFNILRNVWWDGKED
jgi:hypothetical protein